MLLIENMKKSVVGVAVCVMAAALCMPVFVSAKTSLDTQRLALDMSLAWADGARRETTMSTTVSIDDAFHVAGVATLPLNLNSLVADIVSNAGHGLVSEEHCLAQAVYFEARSEALKGQLAVAQVVLNRVSDERYPNTICEVVFQGEQKRHRCQFSFACDGLSDQPRNAQAWSISKAVSHIALNDYWEDVTSLSTHYHADYASPYWESLLDEQVQVGRHIFYRDNSF